MLKISEITGMEGDMIMMQDLYHPQDPRSRVGSGARHIVEA